MSVEALPEPLLQLPTLSNRVDGRDEANFRPCPDIAIRPVAAY
jgi:hypothetical protein